MKALQWVLLTASLGALACGGPKGYVIRGEVTGFPDSTMLYLANLNTQTTVDSALVVDGRFQMRGVLAEEPERMQLYTQVDQRHIYAPLLIGNDNIEVKGDIGDFPFQVSVSGSKYQDQAEAVNALSREYWQESLKRDSVCWTSLWSTREAENNAVSVPYKVRSYPYFFVIDPQGTIVQRWSGYGPDTFEKKIGRLKNK